MDEARAHKLLKQLLEARQLRAHLVAGTERLKAAIREQREGQDE